MSIFTKDELNAMTPREKEIAVKAMEFHTALESEKATHEKVQKALQEKVDYLTSVNAEYFKKIPVAQEQFINDTKRKEKVPSFEELNDIAFGKKKEE
jgi:septal ring factor EnvC (AmiA/AmiB activator)